MNAEAQHAKVYDPRHLECAHVPNHSGRLSFKACLEAFRCEAGASLVEMAIASVVLFGMIFGIIFAGWALYAYDFVSDAAREGARYAIVRGADCTGFSDCNAANSDIQTHVQSISYPGIVSGNLTVATEWYTVALKGGSATTFTDCGSAPVVAGVVCNAPGNQVKVTVTYTVPFSIPFQNQSPIQFSSTSALIISQ